MRYEKMTAREAHARADDWGGKGFVRVSGTHKSANFLDCRAMMYEGKAFIVFTQAADNNTHDMLVRHDDMVSVAFEDDNPMRSASQTVTQSDAPMQAVDIEVWPIRKRGDREASA
jgi:hypothetical protein